MRQARLATEQGACEHFLTERAPRVVGLAGGLAEGLGWRLAVLARRSALGAGCRAAHGGAAALQPARGREVHARQRSGRHVERGVRRVRSDLRRKTH